MREHKLEYVSEENEMNSEPIRTQRVMAIEEAIKSRSFDPHAITNEQKKLLRKLVKKEYPALKFTDPTFDKT